MKLKVTLSFRGVQGGDGNILKNVQVTLGLPHNVWTEQTTFKYQEMNFSKSTTPQVVQMYLYPTRDGCPIDSRISVSVTYSQMKDSAQSQGGLQRTCVASATLPLTFFV